MTLDPGPLPDWLAVGRRWALVLLVVLVIVALPFQALDRGYRSLKRALAVEAYLPDEAARVRRLLRSGNGSRAASFAG
jgi:hypothetical protein